MTLPVPRARGGPVVDTCATVSTGACVTTCLESARVMRGTGDSGASEPVIR